MIASMWNQNWERGLFKKFYFLQESFIVTFKSWLLKPKMYYLKR